MDKYYIALYKLGVKNEHILKLIREYDKELIPQIFNGNFSVFNDDIDWLEYKILLENPTKIRNAINAADNILRINQRKGIHTALYGTADYPCYLRDIDNPPAIIYYKGSNPNNGYKKTIACIGTRHPTRFGFNAVNYLVPQWVNEGFAIVSGLASGIDRLSHISCIIQGGKTIAVLAHGLDMVYPKTNQKLAANILDCGGTLLSEYPVGTRPDKFKFVQRNRIIVALSKATVAMECETRSGTMHTVDFAQKQKCPIFCPDPGKSPEESQSGLEYIIQNNIGVGLKNGRDFQKVIDAAGFTRNQTILSTNYIMNQYLKALLFSIEDDKIIRSVLHHIGLRYDNEYIDYYNLYHDLCKFITSTQYPIHALIDLLIKNIISYTSTEQF